MADDQVKYSDLIVEDDAINNLLKDLDKVKGKIAEVKQEAAGLSRELGSVSTATREHQQATAQQATAAENLRRRTRELADEQSHLESALEQARKKYKKLNDEELQSIMALRQALKGESQDQINAAKAIDIQTKSYNELYQTYNALKDALNQMTVAERENSEAGKVMVNRAKEIRDTLNNLQQQTGNYALNVGNYMSAMNGLQFQAQQLIREIPSAINLQQFFLAISNNVPMFADALSRYNKGLPEIKAKLADVTAEIAKQNAQLAAMNVESAEYAAKQAQINELRRQEHQLQGTTVSGWKAVMTAVGSWQTLLIAGLLLLRKLPDIFEKIKEKVKGLAGKIAELREKTKEMQLQAERNITFGVEESVLKVRTELDLIIKKLAEVKQGSKAWKDGVKSINELIGENIDLHNADIKKIREVANEYIEMYRKIEKNKAIVQILAEDDINKLKRESVKVQYWGFDAKQVATTLGIKGEEREDFVKEYDKIKNEIYKMDKSYNKINNLINANVENNTEENRARRNQAYWKLKNAQEELQAFIDTYTLVLSDTDRQMYENAYELVEPLKKENEKKPKKPKKEKEKDKVQSLLALQRELEDAIIANIENEFEREEAAEIARHQRFIEDKQKELELVKGDAERTAVINQQIEEEQNTHDKNMLNIDEKYRQILIKRSEDQQKREEQAQKEAERAAKEKIQQEEKDFKAHQEIEKRKFELTKHSAVEEKKFVMQQQLEFLKWRIDHAAALGISKDMLEVMQREYEEMFRQFQAGNYSTGQKNISGSASNIIDLIFPDWDADKKRALNSVFDQAKEALNSWMDARKAAADQAKQLADDEVSAAENALNREIELRNQGYANDVALRERELANAKEMQKKAAEEQKKIAQQQILLDAALQASSMITASANIIKQFPNPLAWGPMLAVMWGAYSYAKLKAYQEAGNVRLYREGGVMLLEGGSHQSGHDVNLGIGPDGSNLRAEGGEYFAVINKRNSRKYSGEIPGIVNALNSGMFEDRYIKTSDAVGLLPRIIRADDGTAVDLSAVESGVGELVKQGETSYNVVGDYMEIRYKNRVRRVRVS